MIDGQFSGDIYSFLGISRICQLLEHKVSDNEVREMEMFVLKTVKWQVDVFTISERVFSLISRYGFNSSESARINSLRDFTNTINDLTKCALLLPKCCTGNYQSLSLAVLYAIFDLSRAESQRIAFSKEIQFEPDISWVHFSHPRNALSSTEFNWCLTHYFLYQMETCKQK